MERDHLTQITFCYCPVGQDFRWPKWWYGQDHLGIYRNRP